jgi:PAS domain S-box-containing protein
MDPETIYEQSFGTVEGWILILDAQTGSIIDANRFPAKLLDYSKAELLGKTLWDICLSNDIDTLKQKFQELTERQHLHYDDLPLVTKGGICVNVEVVGNVRRVNGNKVIQCNIHTTGQRNTGDQLAQRMQQTRRLETVGQLSVEVAHDFNNFLGVILGYCDLLKNETNLPEQTREMIAEIYNASTSAKSLAQRLLAFSRTQTLQPVIFDLNEAVHHMQNMRSILGWTPSKSIQLECSFDDELGTIYADPSQVDQILLNLVINARDAMPKGGKIVISTTNVEIDKTSARQYPSTKPGRYIMLTLSDTGIGMDVETQSHIFEPYFSTKPSDQGTGIGLSTVASIVKQMRGTIIVSSVLGVGSTFRILFPRCNKAAAVLPDQKAKLLQKEPEAILLVDDSASLRKLMRHILIDGGYTVLDSGDPAKALRMATEYSGPIPLLITDIILPGFNGSALAEAIAEVIPGVNVLYVSGYSDELIVPSRMLGHDCAFLVKPFTPKDLLGKVSQLLSSSVKLPSSVTL